MAPCSRPTTSLFVYGTLQFPAVLAAVTGRRFPSRRATLAGYRRLRVRGTCYPGILAMPGHRVEGRLIRDIDPATLELLDRFEDTLYRRLRVSTDTTDGARIAWTYVVADEHQGCLEEADWNAGRFRRREYHPYLNSCRRFRQAALRKIR